MSYVTQAETFRERPLAAGDSARFWHEERYDGLECLTASYHLHVFARHTHETYALGAITAGCELFEVSGVRHAGVAGDLVAVHPDEAHDGMPAVGGYAYRMLYPSRALLAELAADLAGRPATGTITFRAPVMRDPELSAAFIQAHAALEASGGALRADEAMLAMLGRLLQRHARIAVAELRGPERRAIDRARDYLDAHAGENVDLATLAKVAGLSRSHLIRAFRRQIGLTPHAFLIDRRVRLARSLLRQGESPVAVAAAVGFADQAHLTRAFKARVGVTPGHYARLA
jgi:AraC-like DNA-binding protein